MGVVSVLQILHHLVNAASRWIRPTIPLCTSIHLMAEVQTNQTKNPHALVVDVGYQKFPEIGKARNAQTSLQKNHLRNRQYRIKSVRRVTWDEQTLPEAIWQRSSRVRIRSALGCPGPFMEAGGRAEQVWWWRQSDEDAR